MKQSISFLLLVLYTITCTAQLPEAINYQAVARDVNNSPLANQDLGIQISVLQGSTNGLMVYRETHQTTTTDLGLFTLEIGRGTVFTGVFENIDWGDNTYFLKVEIDKNGGNNYEEISTTQLLSVPYSLHSKTAEFAENGTHWDENANGIYYDDGYVGIGTSIPQHPFHVVNLDGGSNRGMVITHGVNGPDLAERNTALMVEYDKSLGSAYSRINFRTENSDGQKLLFGSLAINYKNTSSNAEQGDLVFATRFGPNYGERMRISSIGNIGIGTPNPKAKLQVSNGDVYLEQIDSGVIMTSPDGQCWRMTVSNSGQPVINAITCP